MHYFFKCTVGKYTQFLFVCPAGGGEIAAVGRRQLWKSQERKQTEVLEQPAFQRLIKEKCCIDLAVLLAYI